MRKPDLFFACSNVKDDYLASLSHEMHGILQSLIGFRDNDLLRVDYPPYSADDQILFDYLRRYGSNRPLDIFHYSGHAGAHHFLTEKGPYREEEFLALLTGIKPKLVFLNGCATKGFVNQLLANGVGAVIATSVSVGDKQACDFAVRFYQSFTEKKTLHEAFNQAKSVPVKQKNANAEEVIIAIDEVTDAPRGWGNLPSKDPLSAWGIYYSDTLADYNNTGQSISIKDWQLVTIDQPRLALSKPANDILQEIDQIKEGANAKAIEAKIIRARTRLTQTPDDAYVKEDLLEAEKAYTDNVTNPISILNAKLFRILQEPALKSRRLEIAKEFQELNYLDQIDYLGKKEIGRSPLGALILQGGQLCGLKLLQEIMVEKHLKLPIHTDSYRIEEIDLQSRVYSGDEIMSWMKGRFSRAQTMNDLINQLDQLCSIGINVVFVLKNFTKTVEQQQLLILKNFWEQLVRQYQTSSPYSTNPKGRVLLFILDKNCVTDQTSETVVSQNETSYLQDFANDSQFAYVVPIVQKVKNTAVKEWLSRSFRAYRKEGFDLSKFESPDFMLNAIKKACQEAEATILKEKLALYENEFAHYADLTDTL